MTNTSFTSRIATVAVATIFLALIYTQLQGYYKIVGGILVFLPVLMAMYLTYKDMKQSEYKEVVKYE